MSAWLILVNRPAILHPAEYFHPPGWGNGYDMATYDFLFNSLGLRVWCDAGKTSDGPLSMADLLARANGAKESSIWDLPFPSLDALNDACGRIAQSRDLTKGVENVFLERIERQLNH